MPPKKQKFEGCLLRDTAGELSVVEWDQLVTTVDKVKLTVGSSVGYKISTNKRGRIIRGTILVIGELQIVMVQHPITLL